MSYKTYNPAIAEQKKKNAIIFRETTKYFQAGGYTTPAGKEIRFDFTQMLQIGRCFQQEIPTVFYPMSKEKPLA